MLNKFTDRVTDVQNTSEHVMDFSYVNCKNKFSLDKEEVVARMSIWQMYDGNHADLLAKMIKPEDISSSIYVITADLSKPWGVSARQLLRSSVR